MLPMAAAPGGMGRGGVPPSLALGGAATVFGAPNSLIFCKKLRSG
jgi:hypothetical protein